MNREPPDTSSLPAILAEVSGCPCIRCTDDASPLAARQRARHPPLPAARVELSASARELHCGIVAELNESQRCGLEGHNSARRSAFGKQHVSAGKIRDWQHKSRN
jgi:hypothetical protein